MSYLFEIVNDLYNKLTEYYEKNNDEFCTLTGKNQIHNEIANIWFEIVHGVNNFYNIFGKSFINNFYDYDYYADGLEIGIYINPHVRLKQGSRDIYEHYFEHKNISSLYGLKDAYIARKMMNRFINIMRRYYKNDLFTAKFNDETYIKMRNLYNSFSFIVNRTTEIQKPKTYEEVIDAISASELVLFDKASELIDSNEFKKDVLKQQKYYIDELTALKEIILTKGNITKLSDEVIRIYLEFIDIFILKATQKATLLGEVIKSSRI